MSRVAELKAFAAAHHLDHLNAWLDATLAAPRACPACQTALEHTAGRTDLCDTCRHTTAGGTPVRGLDGTWRIR
ncbi:MAG: hypothetical protein KJ056_12640 [Acidimicrobiia bacterium]|nr:hypothetical protein [Acidimicrobiia bacterium]